MPATALLTLPPPIDTLRLRKSILADPVQAAQTYFNFDCKTWEQADLMRSPFRYPRTIFSSGTSLGKTFSYKVLPWLWILSRHRGGVIITSTDHKALDEKIWPMVGEGYKECAAAIGGHLTSKLWCQDLLVQYPRIVKMKPDNAISAKGWHPPGGLLILIDEASFLCEPGALPLLRALQSSGGGEHDSIAMTMNPDFSIGPAIEALEGPDYEEDPIIGYHKIVQSALNSPNVIAGYDIIPGFCSKKRVEYVRKTEGEDSYEWRVKILGLPPLEDELTVIPPAYIDQAAARYKRADENEEIQGVVGDVIVGIDTSLTLAGDQNTLWARDANRVLFQEGIYLDKSQERYDWASRCLKEIEATWKRPATVNIDRMGDPEICGRLIADGWNVRPIGFGDDPHDPGVYRNQRAEMAYGGRIWLRERHGMIPPEFAKILRPECQVQRKPGGDVKQLEDKDAVKKRIKRSCDNFDAFIQLFAERPGEAAFASSDNAKLKLRVQPLVECYFDPAKVKARRDWCCYPKGSLKDIEGPYREHYRFARFGDIHRIIWLARSAESGCIWVHVDRAETRLKDLSPIPDPGGCWTVFNALRWPAGTPLDAIARDVAARSIDPAGYWHDYDMDSASGNDSESLLFGLSDIIEREAKFKPQSKAMGYVQAPSWIEPETIRGKRGLDIVDDLRQGTIQKRVGPMILVWPEAVIKDLDDVKLKSQTSEQRIYGEARDDLADGPLSKCLRLLAVLLQGD